MFSWVAVLSSFLLGLGGGPDPNPEPLPDRSASLPCGPACLAVVLSDLGVSYENEELLDLVEDDGRSMTVGSLVDDLRRRGIDARIESIAPADLLGNCSHAILLETRSDPGHPDGHSGHFTAMLVERSSPSDLFLFDPDLRGQGSVRRSADDAFRGYTGTAVVINPRFAASSDSPWREIPLAIVLPAVPWLLAWFVLERTDRRSSSPSSSSSRLRSQ